MGYVYLSPSLRWPWMTAKGRLEALLDDGIDEPDEALAEKVGCKISTIKDYRQEWQRRNGVCGQRLRIPPEAEVEIIALRNDGLTFPLVAQAVNEQFGIRFTATRPARSIAAAATWRRSRRYPPTWLPRIYRWRRNQGSCGNCR